METEIKKDEILTQGQTKTISSTAEPVFKKDDTKPEQGPVGWKKPVKELTNFMWVVVIVLFIGFAAAFIAVGGMLQNYLAQNQATFQNLVNQVTAQNEDIKLLIQLQQNANEKQETKISLF